MIRHGEPEWEKDGLNIDDPPLTDRGHQQAELVADILMLEDFDAIYVSPLVRARQTVAPLLERLDRPENIQPWLEEIRTPDWQGVPRHKAEEAFKTERAQAAHDRWDGIPGGESMRDFVHRIRRDTLTFLDEHGVRPAREDLPVWAIDKPGMRIALVAHGGTCSVMLTQLLGLVPVPWEWDRFVLGHASITRLEGVQGVGDGHIFALNKLADVEHLPVPLRTR